MWQHGKVALAVKNGELIKPLNCSVCGEEDFLEGHHTDYSKPLDVIWVCKPCHTKIHNSSGRPMGRKPKEIKADKTIRVYVTNEQKMALEQHCFESGISESSLVNQLLRKAEIF